MEKDRLSWEIVARDTILDDMDEAICVVDNNGIVTVWNKKSEQIYDLPKSEIVGRYMGDVLQDTVIIDVLKTGIPKQNIYRSTRTGCSILVRAKLLYNQDEVIGVMCVDKDLSELDELKDEVDKLKARINFLENKERDKSEAGMIGNSKPMQELMYKAARVAKSDVSILICGESGVGKKALGRELHRISERKGMFIDVNCGAIPGNLFEEEFFGVESEDRAGLFELADGGTLYLGEVADMSIQSQIKLLNVLQNMKISRVGSKKKVDINVRIISATGKNMKELVQKGEFLEDLYYRLNVIELEVPSLRERGADITILADYFLKRLAEKYQVDQPSISPGVMNVLLEYEWHGNIRELKNILEHMIVMSGGKEITMKMIPYAVRESAGRFARSYSQINDLAKSVGEYEKHIIEDVLESNAWNKSQAARALNIPRTTLMYKIEQYNLEKERKPKKRK